MDGIKVTIFLVFERKKMFKIAYFFWGDYLN